MMEWNETLAKAEKKLADSKKCFELYGDEDSRRWIAEDEKKVSEIKDRIKKVVAYMDAHNIN
jgi:hypothetical protein